jgi:16S rRNA processing protein RimM
MEPGTKSWTVLARLLRPQGRKGELLAELFTDFPDSFTERDNLFLVPQNFDGEESEGRIVKVVSSWLPVGKNHGRIVLHIEGVSSITEAETLAGLDIAVREAERLALDEDESYVSDLTGCSVYDGETLVGEVTGVQFPSTPEGGRLNDVASLLEVQTPEGDELLIPFVKAFLVSLDLAERKIIFTLPLGLLEVNR